MKSIIKGVIVILVVFILFWALQTPHHWTAIAVLLIIIFYGLFANPMGKVHAHAVEREKRLTKKKRKKKRKN